MARIQVLPPGLVNQIAAGEVVERPASVVKELVENALDAGARSVSIDVEEGGLALVRVADDGAGMDRDDAVLSLERHATSKLRDAAGLAAISTMGFRGEALPAIASVSRFRLDTAPAEDGQGTRLDVEGGVVREIGAVGRPRGTTIEVRDLFFNTPARRKFMRSAAERGGARDRGGGAARARAPGRVLRAPLGRAARADARAPASRCPSARSRRSGARRTGTSSAWTRSAAASAFTASSALPTTPRRLPAPSTSS